MCPTYDIFCGLKSERCLILSMFLEFFSGQEKYGIHVKRDCQSALIYHWQRYVYNKGEFRGNKHERKTDSFKLVLLSGTTRLRIQYLCEIDLASECTAVSPIYFSFNISIAIGNNGEN